MNDNVLVYYLIMHPTVGISCKWAGGENAYRSGPTRSQKKANTFLLQPDGLPDLLPIQCQRHAIKRDESHLSTACRVRWHALTGPSLRSGNCLGARSKHDGPSDPARRLLKL